jgi:hypothetical protein
MRKDRATIMGFRDILESSVFLNALGVNQLNAHC